MPIKFTDLTIQKLKQGVYFDERTPSFGIRVGKNRKTWLVLKGANRTKVRLGHYPALSLHDARRKALVALGSALQPQAAPTFPEALEWFLEHGKWKKSSKYVLEHNLRKYFTWTRPLNKITHEDVAQVLEEIKGQSAASHALKDIRTFFNWCVPRYLSQSPCVGLKTPIYVSRQRVLTDKELKRVWTAAVEMGYPFGVIVKLLVLTGQRRGEIASLKREYLKEDSITLPASLTKNGREHTFPLGISAAKILQSIAITSGYMFPARGTQLPRPYNGWGKHLKELQKRSQTKDWTLHDLRRTFATGLASLAVPIHVTEKILNHVSGTTGGIVAVYQKFAYWEEQKLALEKWESRLDSLAR